MRLGNDMAGDAGQLSLYAGRAGALVRYHKRQAAQPNKKLDNAMILIRQYLLVGAISFSLLYEWLLQLAGTHSIYR